MTKEEIINGLIEYRDHPTYMLDPDILDGAISALSVPEKGEYIKIDDLDDTILHLNNDGWEITRSERKVIRNVLYEMPLYSFPNREKGEWLKFKNFESGYFHIKCSNCGQYWSIDNHAKTFKYCFNCGAEMHC